MDVVNGKVIRDRNWFITINPQAECYIKFKEILFSQKSVIHYAYIFHKADEDNENDNHIHLVLEYKNQRTFEGIQNIFVGAHIEHAKFKYQCYKYLIHKGYDDKLQYKIEDIKCDSIDYYKNCINSDEFDKLDTYSILDDIANGIDNLTLFVHKYGIHQVKNYINVLKTLLIEHNYLLQLDSKNNEIIRLNDEINKCRSENKDLKERIYKLENDKGYLPF